MAALDRDALAQLFLEARTPKKWLQSSIAAEELHRLYDLIRMAPTSNNGSPARFIFVGTAEARAKLMPAIHAGNHKKVEQAPVICLICYDASFWRHWQILSPHKNLQSIFGDAPGAAGDEAFKSALLQAGYLILAARALGLDAFPLTGFDPQMIDASFLDDEWTPFMLCCLGHGDPTENRPRAARLSFEQACRML